MDLSTILVKIAGGVFLIWTLFSIYKHFKDHKINQQNKKEEVQSLSEQILNNILLYLWLLFMIAFSVGMIVNN
jgi:hypothetical protein